MIKEPATHHGVIMPEELAMLQRVFDTIIEHRGLHKESSEALKLAALVINLYEHGVRQEHQLKMLVPA